MAHTVVGSSFWRTVGVAVLAVGLVVAGPVAFAEEAPPASDPAPTEPAPEPAQSEPAQSEPAYVPPPEAHEGVGGWAVVDPATGNVHGAIVCTVDVCGPGGSWGGVMPTEYMGCAAGCVLRFQTRATADGNVAGWGGPGVSWNESARNFSIQTEAPGGTRTMTLVPERTARDAQGMDLHTGIVDIETRSRVESSGQSADVRLFQRDFTQNTTEVSIAFPLWVPEQRIFSYVLSQGWSGEGSPSSVLEDIGSDVDSALFTDGHIRTDVSEDPDTGEVVETTVVDEGSGFVQAIRQVTASVLEFLGGVLGLTPREAS